MKRAITHVHRLSKNLSKFNVDRCVQCVLWIQRLSSSTLKPLTNPHTIRGIATLNVDRFSKSHLERYRETIVKLSNKLPIFKEHELSFRARGQKMAFYSTHCFATAESSQQGYCYCLVNCYCYSAYCIINNIRNHSFSNQKFITVWNKVFESNNRFLFVQMLFRFISPANVFTSFYCLSLSDLSTGQYAIEMLAELKTIEKSNFMTATECKSNLHLWIYLYKDCSWLHTLQKRDFSEDFWM